MTSLTSLISLAGVALMMVPGCDLTTFANPDGGQPPSATCVELGQADVFAPVQGDISVPRDLGRILSCVHTQSVSAQTASQNSWFTQHGMSADNGYEQFAIQYVSQGPIGKMHRVTALLFLPTGGHAPYPVVAVNHGTSGMGPSCGATHYSVVVDYMAIPLAAKGYAVVATDYAGMGVDDGVAAYGDGEAEALNILDGIRALRRFHDTRFDASMLDDGVFLFGHSQGGQSTLFAHQLWDPGVGGKLLGSLSFAPGFGDMRGLGSVLGDGTRATDAFTIFLTMALYGDMSYHGAPDASSWLTLSAQAQLPSLLHDQCFTQLEYSVPLSFPKQSDLFTSDFLQQMAACPFTGPCAGLQPFSRDLLGDVPGNFKSDVPVLLLQGEKDQTVAPYTTACVAKRLADHGTAVATCAYPSTDHTSIVNDALGDALTWMAARRRGQTMDVCQNRLSETCP